MKNFIGTITAPRAPRGPTAAPAEPVEGLQEAFAPDLAPLPPKAAPAPAYGFYVVRVGYQLNDPSTGTVITHKPTKAEVNDWVREQLDARLIREVPAPASE
jgi:hypothetical protein